MGSILELFSFFFTLYGFCEIELKPARELNFERPEGPGNHILAFRKRVATLSSLRKLITPPPLPPSPPPPPLRHKVFYGPVWEALRLRLEILAKSLWFGGPG